MTAFDDALRSGNPRVGIYFRLGITPPSRMWLGIGDCRVGIDAEDGSGEIYYGLGEILNVPQFSQLINGTADRVQFKLSGTTQRVATLAAAEASDVKGVLLKVGIALFDEEWAVIESPTWLRTFVVDYLTVERQQDGETATWTVSLAARSLFTGRRRPGLSFWTDNDQQTRFPGDRFCERALLYSVDNTKAWPKL
jgi:hypothetical protein